jgi:hypothetical protein
MPGVLRHCGVSDSSNGATLPTWRFLSLMYQNCVLFCMFLIYLSYFFFKEFLPRLTTLITHHPHHTLSVQYSISDTHHLPNTPSPQHITCTLHYLHHIIFLQYITSTKHHLQYTKQRACVECCGTIFSYYMLRIVFTQDWNLVNYVFIPSDHI